MSKLNKYIINHYLTPNTNKNTCWMCGVSIKFGNFCSKECEKLWVED